jgi:hypothetical protein
MLVNSRFADFLAKHNSGLMAQECAVQYQEMEEVTFFNCFKPANFSQTSDNFLSKPLSQKKAACSPKASSNLSEKVSRRSNSNKEDTPNTACKINFRGVVQDLLVSEVKVHHPLEKNSNSKRSTGRLDLKFNQTKNGRSSNLSEPSSERKGAKTSLREKKVSKKTAKEGLNYRQLLDTVKLGLGLRPSLAASTLAGWTTSRLP